MICAKFLLGLIIMEKKDYENFQSRGTEIPQGMKGGGGEAAPLDLNYFREARLFLGKDRATLTFYVEQEVASIHYDMIRDEVFYRGHNVKNMTMSQEKWDLLQKFSQYLDHDPRAESLVRSYRTCLEHLMTHHGLSL